MEEELIIMPHAYKHGLTEDEIRFAWRHALYRFTRLDDSRGDVVVVIGPTDELGLLTHQMTYCAGIVGRHHDEETIFVFHAKRPPVDTLIEELRQWRGEM
ncbi:MAG: hypothetical protein IKS49_06960 [Actinomycetaceae bacterium]|nr:hypothetical protein [Actinomycetaceae bacterium]